MTEIPVTDTDATDPAVAREFPIDLRNVTRRFGRQVAVDDLTLRIPRGKTLGFIGLNGAGKTTAIRMMVGLLAPHAGRIRIDDIDVWRDRNAMKSHVGYVPDRPTVYPWMRVEEAIGFARTFYPHWNQARCDELLKLFDLDLRKRAKHLSKGQAAKLSLILAICHDPPVLILDEPTSGMDPLVREEFLEGVLDVTSERGQTVLFSSHTLSDVQRLATASDCCTKASSFSMHPLMICSIAPSESARCWKKRTGITNPRRGWCFSVCAARVDRDGREFS